MAAEVPYAGDVTPDQAWRMLHDDPEAVLVDVRTMAEWRYVGGPDLSGAGRDVVHIEWVSFPGDRRNEDFLPAIGAACPGKEAPVLFLCRSGARSAAAATAAAGSGWSAAFNIGDGFEGPVDEAGHRGTVAGWKAAGLPWRQS